MTQAVRPYRARDALIGALPVVCRDELRALWTTVQHEPSSAATAVSEWAAKHHLAAPWLVARLTSAVSLFDTPDLLARPTLALQTQWRDQDRLDFALDCETLKASWNDWLPTLANPNDHDEPPRVRESMDEIHAHQLLKPINADPVIETWGQFLARAKAHFEARAQAYRSLGYATLGKSPALDASWFLRYQVRRESFPTIAGSQKRLRPGSAEWSSANAAQARVKKAIERFAAEIKIPLRPTKTKKHRDK